MRKVCHVTSLHPVLDGRIFQKECRSLSKEYEVYLIAPNTEDRVINGVFIRGVVLPKNRLKRSMCLNRVFRKMVEIDADIYHFHDPELIPIGCKAKKNGKVVIFDSHEDVPADILQKKWIPFIFRKPLSLYYKWYESVKLKKFDALITVTPSIVERLSKINPKTVMVTNYPLYEDLSTDRQFGRFICFAGGIMPSWMHDNILESIKDIDCKYLLAGKVSQSYFSSLSEHKAWPKVEFLGVIKHEEVVGLYHRSIAGMALYDYNGYLGEKEGTLGNTKIFEYMQAGIPIIATDFRLWKEIIDKYKCGICVNPRNVAEITKAIEYLLSHPLEAKEMGDNGLVAFRKEFNWRSQETILLQLYQCLINND